MNRNWIWSQKKHQHVDWFRLCGWPLWGGKSTETDHFWLLSMGFRYPPMPKSVIPKLSYKTDILSCGFCSIQSVFFGSFVLKCQAHLATFPPSATCYRNHQHPIAHHLIVEVYSCPSLSISCSSSGIVHSCIRSVDGEANVMTRGEANYPNRPNHPPRSSPSAVVAGIGSTTIPK